jgi:hypothetical protein
MEANIATAADAGPVHLPNACSPVAVRQCDGSKFLWEEDPELWEYIHQIVPGAMEKNDGEPWIEEEEECFTGFIREIDKTLAEANEEDPPAMAPSSPPSSEQHCAATNISPPTGPVLPGDPTGSCQGAPRPSHGRPDEMINRQSTGAAKVAAAAAKAAAKQSGFQMLSSMCRQMERDTGYNFLIDMHPQPGEYYDPPYLDDQLHRRRMLGGRRVLSQPLLGRLLELHPNVLAFLGYLPNGRYTGAYPGYDVFVTGATNWWQQFSLSSSSAPANAAEAAQDAARAAAMQVHALGKVLNDTLSSMSMCTGYDFRIDFDPCPGNTFGLQYLNNQLQRRRTFGTSALSQPLLRRLSQDDLEYLGYLPDGRRRHSQTRRAAPSVAAPSAQPPACAGSPSRASPGVAIAQIATSPLVASYHQGHHSFNHCSDEARGSGNVLGAASRQPDEDVVTADAGGLAARKPRRRGRRGRRGGRSGACRKQHRKPALARSLDALFGRWDAAFAAAEACDALANTGDGGDRADAEALFHGWNEFHTRPDDALFGRWDAAFAAAEACGTLADTGDGDDHHADADAQFHGWNEFHTRPDAAW